MTARSASSSELADASARRPQRWQSYAYESIALGAPPAANAALARARARHSAVASERSIIGPGASGLAWTFNRGLADLEERW